MFINCGSNCVWSFDGCESGIGDIFVIFQWLVLLMFSKNLIKTESQFSGWYASNSSDHTTGIVNCNFNRTDLTNSKNLEICKEWWKVCILTSSSETSFIWCLRNPRASLISKARMGYSVYRFQVSESKNPRVSCLQNPKASLFPKARSGHSVHRVQVPESQIK